MCFDTIDARYKHEDFFVDVLLSFCCVYSFILIFVLNVVCMFVLNF